MSKTYKVRNPFVVTWTHRTMGACAYQYSKKDYRDKDVARLRADPNVSDIKVSYKSAR